MSDSGDSLQTTIQAKLFDFALTELVFKHRDSFQPLWTVESWVKFLIWMALNCGLSGEQESLELFVDSLGSPLLIRMRKVFFERTLDDLSVRLMADPADPQALLMPINQFESITHEQATEALEQVGLLQRVVLDRDRWKAFDSVIAIPWHSADLVS